MKTVQDFHHMYDDTDDILMHHYVELNHLLVCIELQTNVDRQSFGLAVYNKLVPLKLYFYSI